MTLWWQNISPLLDKGIVHTVFAFVNKMSVQYVSQDQVDIGRAASTGLAIA